MKLEQLIKHLRTSSQPKDQENIIKKTLEIPHKKISAPQNCAGKSAKWPSHWIKNNFNTVPPMHSLAKTSTPNGWTTLQKVHGYTR